MNKSMLAGVGIGVASALALSAVASGSLFSSEPQFAEVLAFQQCFCFCMVECAKHSKERLKVVSWRLQISNLQPPASNLSLTVCHKNRNPMCPDDIRDIALAEKIR